MAVTALAGPVSNLLLAAAAVGISRLIYQYAPYTGLWNALFEFFLLTLAPAFHRVLGIVQPDSHSAAGRVQGGGSVLAR